MLWLLGCACVAGLLIGLRYRAPAALAASAVAGAAAAIWSANSSTGLGGGIAMVVLTVLTLQIAYLAGVVVSARRQVPTHGRTATPPEQQHKDPNAVG